MSESTVLSTVDVARLKNWNRVRAWRWIRRFGYKSGNRWVIDRSAVERARTSPQKPPPDERILVRIRKLAEDIRECSRRLDVHARELSELRRR